MLILFLALSLQVRPMVVVPVENKIAVMQQEEKICAYEAESMGRQLAVAQNLFLAGDIKQGNLIVAAVNKSLAGYERRWKKLNKQKRKR